MHLDDNDRNQFYMIDSLSLDVSLEWKANLVVAWFVCFDKKFWK